MKYIFCLIFLLSSAAFSKDIQKLLNKAELIYAENPAESFALYETAEREAKQQNTTEYNTQINLGKARYYILIAKYQSASALLNECILDAKTDEDGGALTHALSLKSILLERIGENEASHQLELEVLSLNKKYKDTASIINSLTNLSLNYLDMNDLDSMQIILEELDGFLPSFDEYDYYYYNQNWGTYFVATQQYNRAIQHYQSALKIAEELVMIDSKATVMMLIAKAFEDLGELKTAREWANKSYVFSQENNLIYEAYEALEVWISIEKAARNFEKALELQDDWIRLDREINDLEKLQKVNAIEAQLKLVEKEKQFAESQANLQAERLSNQKERTKNAWLTGVVVLIVALLIFVGVIYRKTKILNHTISEQKKEVELKSMKLEEALTSIEDSLTYSKLIQSSLLPSQESFSRSFKQAAIFYLPKDIVSGDFYWNAEISDAHFIAVGDCTGHGVPGAMVSIVCQEALNKVVKEMQLTEPAQILDEVKIIVSKTFSSDTLNLRDGMDIAFIKMKDNKLSYAGANNPLWLYRKDLKGFTSTHPKLKLDMDNCLLELKADKQPIGQTHQTVAFEQLEIQLEDNDFLFLFSDGYADQFGGEKGKKLKTANLKSIIRSILDNKLDISSELEKQFADWKGELEQVDDVCILGIQV